MAKPRLIDANALMDTVKGLDWYHIDKMGYLVHGANSADHTPIYKAESIYHAIANAPTVDAVPVVHGEWIYHECVSSYDGPESGYSCSHCCAFVTEETFDMDDFHKEFCGHCGAKMDGGNEE